MSCLVGNLNYMKHDWRWKSIHSLEWWPSKESWEVFFNLYCCLVYIIITASHATASLLIGIKLLTIVILVSVQALILSDINHYLISLELSCFLKTWLSQCPYRSYPMSHCHPISGWFNLGFLENFHMHAICDDILHLSFVIWHIRWVFK